MNYHVCAVSPDPAELSRADDKRPDGATLVPWSKDIILAWDATAFHTCPSSYLHLTSAVIGGATEQAAEGKRSKYSSLPSTHEFVLVAMESLVNQRHGT